MFKELIIMFWSIGVLLFNGVIELTKMKLSDENIIEVNYNVIIIYNVMTNILNVGFKFNNLIIRS